MRHDPIAYTYDAAYHCPGCSLARFGTDADGCITGVDSDGKEIGAVASWDEWQAFDGEPETLTCDTCLGVIEEYVPC